MSLQTIHIDYQLYEDFHKLPADDQALISQAKDAALRAYAPYSNFQVGAALRLSNGEVIQGNNQENAAYPSGLCAERVACFYASSLYPEVPFVSIAVYATAAGTLPLSPCGSCRQALLEYENKFRHPIRVIIGNGSDTFFVFDSIASLLPFQFNADFLQ